MPARDAPPVALRAVVDTNIVVSSLFGGHPRVIMNLWRDRKLVLCLSDEIVAEYLEVLARFGDVKHELRDFLALLLQRDNVIFVTPKTLAKPRALDPDDTKFLACAVAAKADVIISGDCRLLALRVVKRIPIIGPADFLARLKSQTERST